MKKLLLISCLYAIGSSAGLAAPSSQWKHHLTAYFLGASMDGNVVLGPIGSEVDLSFSEIADRLELGGMVNYRAEKDKFSLGLDVLYMGLGGSALGMGEVDYDQWMVEGTAGWRLTEMIELIAGVRYNDVAVDVDFDNPLLPTLSKSKGWFDPIVGARLWFPVSSSLDVILRGDVGGFGVGSDLTWQLSGHLRYAFSDSFSGLLGYRYFYMDYESGEGLNRFVYDMAIHGPTLGLSWTF